MGQPVNQDGIFQGQIVEYGLREFDSGAVGISIRASLTSIWNAETEEWEDWTQYDVEASGMLYVIKKGNGGVNQQQVESIVSATGWDGSINSVVNQTWQPTPCQFTVKGETYRNAMQYRIAFVNAHDRVPGGLSNVDTDKAKALEAKYGSSLRAVAGNAKRNAPPSADKPMPAPPKPKGAWKPESAMAQQPAPAVSDDDAPF